MLILKMVKIEKFYIYKGCHLHMLLFLRVLFSSSFFFCYNFRYFFVRFLFCFVGVSCFFIILREGSRGKDITYRYSLWFRQFFHLSELALFSGARAQCRRKC